MSRSQAQNSSGKVPPAPGSQVGDGKAPVESDFASRIRKLASALVNLGASTSRGTRSTGRGVDDEVVEGSVAGDDEPDLEKGKVQLPEGLRNAFWSCSFP